MLYVAVKLWQNSVLWKFELFVRFVKCLGKGVCNECKKIESINIVSEGGFSKKSCKNSH